METRTFNIESRLRTHFCDFASLDSMLRSKHAPHFIKIEVEVKDKSLESRQSPEFCQNFLETEKLGQKKS